MTKKKKEVLFHTRNKHGIRMARCCMSCAFKEETEQKRIRVCFLDKLPHRRCHMCHDWQMSRTMEGAGTSGGRIKRREYLMFALAIRCEEQESLTPNPSPKGEGDFMSEKCKSVEEIRAEFEKEYGSIYVDF